MPFRRLLPSTRSLAALPAMAAALAFAGCGNDPSGPAQPPGPDLSTPEGAIVALEEFYGQRKAPEAIALLSPGYRFYPVQPESIPFINPGETSWDRAAEVAILGELLREERTNWIDQVLLEVDRRQKRVISETRVEIDADVELLFLIGVDTFLKGRSEIVYTYEIAENGDHLLLEERESFALDENGDPLTPLTVGLHKASIFPSPQP